MSTLLKSFGLDPRRATNAARALSWFIRDYIIYRRQKTPNMRMVLAPQLHDRTDGAGSLGEYFWQDLYVAGNVISSGPGEIIDVGSRIDGYVLAVAAVRKISVVDIRPISASIPNVTFRQIDLSKQLPSNVKPASTVTCLHTLEHIGLGRYGDPIGVMAWKSFFKNLCDLVEPGGRLWISCPVGKPCVYFNDHRVFSPSEIMEEMSANSFSFGKIAVWSQGTLRTNVDREDFLKTQASTNYSLAIMEMVRPGGSV